MRILSVFLIVMSLSVSGYSKELKIAVADPLLALFASEQAKKAVAGVEAELASKQQELQKLQQEFQKLQNKLAKEGDTLSDADKRKLQKDLEAKQYEGASLAQYLQQQLKKGQAEIVQAMEAKTMQAMAMVKEEGGYDLILQKQAVLQFDESLDVTAKITEKLNTMK